VEPHYREIVTTQIWTQEKEAQDRLCRAILERTYPIKSALHSWEVSRFFQTDMPLPHTPFILNPTLSFVRKCGRYLEKGLDTSQVRWKVVPSLRPKGTAPYRTEISQASISVIVPALLESIRYEKQIILCGPIFDLLTFYARNNFEDCQQSCEELPWLGDWVIESVFEAAKTGIGLKSMCSFLGSWASRGYIFRSAEEDYQTWRKWTSAVVWETSRDILQFYHQQL
jgi:hypothetical protein